MHHRRNPPPALGREYDIREIDENLYAAVLACRLAENVRPEGDLSRAAEAPQVTGRDRKGQEIG